MLPSRLLSFVTLACLFFASQLGAATPIPFQFRDGLIWVKVKPSGTGEPLNFLLDSGAGSSVLDLAAARRLGVRLGKSQSVQGVDSHSAAFQVKDFAARASGIALPTSILAVDLSGPSRSCHQRIDGLLGVDFFRERIVQIDFGSQTIRLLQRSEVNDAGCEILPIASRNDAMCVSASVDGHKPEWLRLDTGCNTALEWAVTGDKTKKLGVITIGLNPSPVQEFLTDVLLGTKHLSAVKTGVHPRQMFAGESGLIGTGLLSRFIVTIDAANRRCLLADPR